MFNNFFRSRGSENREDDHANDESEVEVTDSTGRTIGRQSMSRRVALEHGHETTSYEQTSNVDRERLSDEVTEQLGEDAQREGVLHEGFNVNQRMNLANPEVPRFLTEKANESRSFGEKTKTFLLGLVTGIDAGAAVTYKTALGFGVRKAIKHTLNFAAPGAGAAVGAIVGGSWEGRKEFHREGQRVEAERARCREALEAITNPEERMEELLKLRQDSDREHLSIEQRQALEEYHAIKRDKVKIGAAVLKGAAIGFLGGVIGGALVEVASFGLHHLADLEKVKAAGDAVKKAFQYMVKPGVENVVNRFEGNDVFQEINKNTWNTVREWYHAHGIAKPSNKLINEGVRKLAALNKIEITEDHLTQAGQAVHQHFADGVRDVAMPVDYHLHHLESLNNLIESAGGQPEQLTMHAPGVDTLIPNLEYVEGGTGDTLKKIVELAASAALIGSGVGLLARRKKQQPRPSNGGATGVPNSNYESVTGGELLGAAGVNNTSDENETVIGGLDHQNETVPTPERATVEKKLASVKASLDSAEQALSNENIPLARDHYSEADARFHTISLQEIYAVNEPGLEDEKDELGMHLYALQGRLLKAEQDLQATKRTNVDPETPPDTEPLEKTGSLSAMENEWRSLLDAAEEALLNNDLETCDQLLEQASNVGPSFKKLQGEQTAAEASAHPGAEATLAELSKRENDLYDKLSKQRGEEEIIEQAEEETHSSPEETPPPATLPTLPDNREHLVDRAINRIHAAFWSAGERITVLKRSPEQCLREIEERLGGIRALATNPATPREVRNEYEAELLDLVTSIHEAGNDGVAREVWKRMDHQEPLRFEVSEEEQLAIKERVDEELQGLEKLNDEIRVVLFGGDSKAASELQAKFEAGIALMSLTLNGLGAERRQSAERRLNEIQTINHKLHSTSGEYSVPEQDDSTSSNEAGAREVVNAKPTKKESKIMSEALAEGIRVYPGMADKWYKFTQPREKGKVLWKLVAQKNISATEAARIVADIKTVTDWTVKKFERTRLIDAFSILLNNVEVDGIEVGAVRRVIQEMRGMDPAMEAACKEAMKINKKNKEQAK